MAKSLSARFGLQRWSADSDTQQRSEFDNDAAQLEALAAMATHGAIGARPAASAATRDMLYLITDATGGGVIGTLYYCDGTTWTAYNSATIAAGLFLAKGGDTATGELTVPDLNVTGLTGSVQPSRYVGRTAAGAPTTGAHVIGDWVLDLTGLVFICTVAGTPGTWVQGGSAAYLAFGGGTLTGELTVPDLKVTGLTGSVQASRYVGATTSGAPSTGAHLLGDWIIDLTGKIFICTTAGTPGTWTQVGSASVTAANPATLGLTTIETAGTVAASLIANQIVYMKFRPIADITITSLRYGSGTASGNCDVGIYADSAGAPAGRLASTGSAAMAGTGVIAKTISSTALTGGTAYWLALVVDNATAAFFTRTVNGPPSADLVKVQTGTFPLPASATPVSSAATTLQVPTLYILT